MMLGVVFALLYVSARALAVTPRAAVCAAIRRNPVKRESVVPTVITAALRAYAAFESSGGSVGSGACVTSTPAEAEQPARPQHREPERRRDGDRPGRSCSRRPCAPRGSAGRRAAAPTAPARGAGSGGPARPPSAWTRKLTTWFGRERVTTCVAPSGKRNQAERSCTTIFSGVGPGSPICNGIVPTRRREREALGGCRVARARRCPPSRYAPGRVQARPASSPAPPT